MRCSMRALSISSGYNGGDVVKVSMWFEQMGFVKRQRALCPKRSWDY